MSVEIWKIELLRKGLSGTVPNSRESNLKAIHHLLDGVPFYTFGIRQVHDAVARGMLDEDGVLAVMAASCGHRDPDTFLSPQGYIDPDATLGGMLEAADLMARVLASGSPRIAFGTGHPGSLLSCYQRLADQLRQRGALSVAGPVGACVGIDWVLDMVGDVAVTSDTCGVLHGHCTRPMEALLAAQKRPVDLVVADHGHAGASINAGIPTIALMDTNDPALAVARCLGAPDLVVVPCFDNRPNAVSIALADLWMAMLDARIAVLT